MALNRHYLYRVKDQLINCAYEILCKTYHANMIQSFGDSLIQYDNLQRLSLDVASLFRIGKVSDRIKIQWKMLRAIQAHKQYRIDI